MTEFFDDDQKDEREYEEKRRDASLSLWLESSFETEGGQLFFSQLLRQSGVIGSTFSTCDRMQAFMEGKRHIGMVVYKTLRKHVPTELAKILTEDKP